MISNRKTQTSKKAGEQRSRGAGEQGSRGERRKIGVITCQTC
jgi:hypothetical protein